ILFSLLALAAPMTGLAMLQYVAGDASITEYAKAQPHDPIADIQRKLDTGELKFEFEGRWGYLPSVLRALKIPVSSQGLVFSKTSFQVDHISEDTPRALYFNDDVYVGWVQGGPVLEFASVDPKLGGIFYTLDQKKDGPIRFDRQVDGCLICH